MAKEEKIEGLNIWLPQKIGDSLIGKIIEFEQNAQFGLQATIKQENGAEIQTPSHKWLQNCLKRMKAGEVVKIIYQGENPPSIKGQSATKKYDVFRISE